MSSPSAALKAEAEFPEKLEFLFEPHRYKVAWGGRGGAKSWGFSRALLIQGAEKRLRILCARETQKSIEESVHKLLSDQIREMGLSMYNVAKTSITGANGTEFIFAGIRQSTASNLKSYEGCDRVWVEEAQALSKRSWNILIPTIRKEGSEIWASFNPELESDETYQRFVVNPPENAKVVRIGWEDNPWVPSVLLQEMKDLRRRSPDDYEHIYGGTCKQVVEGAIYKQEIVAAEKGGQLCRVPYERTIPVNTFWDLGFGDNTSIWFEQSIGFEFRFIDHLSGNLQALGYYLKQMQERGYTYGLHYLPWDGNKAELGTGRSIKEQIEAVYGRGNVFCVKKMPITEGIEAVRAIFPKCYFDAEKCADGLRSLRHYRYAYNDKLLSFEREPMHDWASHDADALRTAAVGVKEQERPKEQQYQPGRSSYGVGRSDGGWMA